MCVCVSILTVIVFVDYIFLPLATIFRGVGGLTIMSGQLGL